MTNSEATPPGSEDTDPREPAVAPRNRRDADDVTGTQRATAHGASGSASDAGDSPGSTSDAGAATEGRDSPQHRAAREPHVAVRLTRTGGLAGITRRWQAEAPEGDASQWVAVIDQCPWDETPPTDSVRTDGFTWRIVAVVRHDERSVVLPESAAVGPWATLISVVRDASVG